jgi:hypothetical protein
MCKGTYSIYKNPTLSMWTIGVDVASKINMKYSFRIGLNCFYYPKAQSLNPSNLCSSLFTFCFLFFGPSLLCLLMCFPIFLLSFILQGWLKYQNVSDQSLGVNHRNDISALRYNIAPEKNKKSTLHHATSIPR